MKLTGYIVAATTAVMIVTGAIAAEDYPRRDITDVVTASAGGGGDVINRLVTAEMAKSLGVNINVVNMPGGNGGSIAMNHVLNKPADGYTLIGQVWSLANPVIFGGWDKKYDTVWDFFLVGGSPDVVSVNANSPYQTIEDLIAFAEENPGELRMAIAYTGSPHHMNLLAFLKGTGIEVEQIPYPGSAPAQNAGLAGEVDVVITSVAEQAALIKGGKLRVLGSLIDEDRTFEGLGTFPSLLKKYPSLKEHLPIPQVLGLGVRKDIPAERLDLLQDAFTEAMASPAVQEWADQNYYVFTGETGEIAREKVNRLESLFSWTVYELGVAENSPADFGIPKP